MDSRIGLGDHLGVGDDGRVDRLRGLHERPDREQHRGRLGLVPLERLDQQREPGRVGEEPEHVACDARLAHTVATHATRNAPEEVPMNPWPWVEAPLLRPDDRQILQDEVRLVRGNPARVLWLTGSTSEAIAYLRREGDLEWQFEGGTWTGPYLFEPLSRHRRHVAAGVKASLGVLGSAAAPSDLLSVMSLLGGVGVALHDLRETPDGWNVEAQEHNFESLLSARASLGRPLVLVLESVDTGASASEAIVARLANGMLRRISSVLVVITTSPAIHDPGHERQLERLNRIATRTHDIKPIVAEEFAAMTGASIDLSRDLAAVAGPDASMLRCLRTAILNASSTTNWQSPGDLVAGLLRGRLDEAIHNALAGFGDQGEQVMRGLLGIAAQRERFSLKTWRDSVGVSSTVAFERALAGLESAGIIEFWPDVDSVVANPMSPDLRGIIVRISTEKDKVHLRSETFRAARAAWEQQTELLPWLIGMAQAAEELNMIDQLQLRLMEAVEVRARTHLLLMAGNFDPEEVPVNDAGSLARELFHLTQDYSASVDLQLSILTYQKVSILAHRGLEWKTWARSELEIATRLASFATHSELWVDPESGQTIVDDVVPMVLSVLQACVDRQDGDMYVEAMSYALHAFAMLGDKENFRAYLPVFRSSSLPRVPSGHERTRVAIAELLLTDGVDEGYECINRLADDLADHLGFVYCELAMRAFGAGRASEALSLASKALDSGLTHVADAAHMMEVIATVRLASSDEDERVEGRTYLLRGLELAYLASQGPCHDRLRDLASEQGIVVDASVAAEPWWLSGGTTD